MNQQEVERRNTAQAEEKVRSRILNKIFIIYLILSTAGVCQVYLFFAYYTTCRVSGWFGYFSVMINMLMSSCIFIFIFIRNSRQTRSYFLFALLSNIQIVFRFIYLNEIILTWMDYVNELREDCWITTWRMALEVIYTIIVISLYFMGGLSTTIYIKHEINFKFSHHTGFLKRHNRFD